MRNLGSIVSAGLLSLVLLVAAAAAGKFNAVLDVGDLAPAWEHLIGVDDAPHSLRDFKDQKVLVVVFLANHCPVSTGYEDRLIAISRAYQDKGVRLIALNASTLPSERLARMKERAEKKGFAFPYLYDPTQKIGQAYGARVTPQAYVLDHDRRIAYMGAIDDDNDPAKARKHYVRDAVEALLAGQTPQVSERRPRGCEIDYRE